MGLINDVVILSLGLGVGYYMAHSNYNDCHKMVADKIVEVQRDFKNVPTSNVVNPKDVGIDYIVSDNFEGYRFTNKNNNQEGVLVKMSYAGKNSFHYLTLDEAVNVKSNVPIVGQEMYEVDKYERDKGLEKSSGLSGHRRLSGFSGFSTNKVMGNFKQKLKEYNSMEE